jgi:hypothetical protein
MAKEQKPIHLREHWPSLEPSVQHNQRDHDGNQQEQIRRFPNQYFTDVYEYTTAVTSTTLPALIIDLLARV